MEKIRLDIEKIVSKEIKNPLNARQREVLRAIVYLYILNASPVGSRTLSKFLSSTLHLSAATIRNVMADLEEFEYINHPHTSAGRIPTDKGYRFYVDNISELAELTDQEVRAVKNSLSSGTSDKVLKDASKVLGLLSKYLGVVQIPHLLDLIVHRIELISVSSNRLLVVIALDSNIVRTVTLEAGFEFDRKYIKEISSYINEKVSGKRLRYLRENFEELIGDFDNKDTPLVRLFVDSLDKIFHYQGNQDRILTAGTQNLLEYPEFEDLGRVKGVIELIENEDIIIHLLEKHDESKGGIKVLIGKELETNLLDDYSIVMTNYRIGSAQGTIGLIGPKRMNYPKMISIVANVSQMLSKD